MRRTGGSRGVRDERDLHEAGGFALGVFGSEVVEGGGGWAGVPGMGLHHRMIGAGFQRTRNECPPKVVRSA